MSKLRCKQNNHCTNSPPSDIFLSNMKKFLCNSAVILLVTMLSVSWTQALDVESMFTPRESNQPIPEFDDSYGVLFKNIVASEDPDIFTIRFRNLNRFFINTKKGSTFKERTIQSGLGGNLEPRQLSNLELGAASADLDNDGLEDVMIVGWGTTRLFRQLPGSDFQDITESAGLNTKMSGNGATFADVDLDGDLDIFIADEHGTNQLYIQTNQNRFSNQASDFGLTHSGISQEATFVDLNGDRYPDLYVCNWLEPDHLYININGQSFERLTLPITHLTESYNSNNASFGDVDNDGDMDLLVTDRHGQSRLYENVSDNDVIGFRDITRKTGLDNFYPSYSGLFADLDNNGWLDIVFTNIGPNIVYTNDQGIFELAYLEETYRDFYSTGAAVADMDRDGDLDLIIANKDTHSVLIQNPLTHSRSIRIQPEGIRSNRNGIGSVISLYDLSDGTPNLMGVRQSGASSGYLSQDENVVHFGIPHGNEFEAVVLFPSGVERRVRITDSKDVIHVPEYIALTG